MSGLDKSKSTVLTHGDVTKSCIKNCTNCLTNTKSLK